MPLPALAALAPAFKAALPYLLGTAASVAGSTIGGSIGASGPSDEDKQRAKELVETEAAKIAAAEGIGMEQATQKASKALEPQLAKLLAVEPSMVGSLIGGLLGFGGGMAGGAKLAGKMFAGKAAAKAGGAAAKVAAEVPKLPAPKGPAGGAQAPIEVTPQVIPPGANIDNALRQFAGMRKPGPSTRPPNAGGMTESVTNQPFSGRRGARGFELGPEVPSMAPRLTGPSADDLLQQLSPAGSAGVVGALEGKMSEEQARRLIMSAQQGDYMATRLLKDLMGA